MTWETGWAIWAVVALVTFAGMEWLTIRRGETLSENLRQWLGIDPPRPWRHLGIAGFTAVVLGFVAWFVPHIVI